MRIIIILLDNLHFLKYTFRQGVSKSEERANNEMEASGINMFWSKSSSMKAGQIMHKHSHDYYQLYYIIDGTPVFIIDDKDYALEKGDCLLLLPGMVHGAKPMKSDFYYEELKFYIHDQFLTDKLKTNICFRDDCFIKRSMEYICENWTCAVKQNTINITTLLSALLLNFALDSIHYENKDSQLVVTRGYNTLTRLMIVYIEKHFTEKFRLTEMANELHYNGNYLSTLFSRTTGISIVDYLNLVRIRQSIIMFAFYGQSVSSACESVGYTSLSYFSRLFKNITGISPSLFRKAFSDSSFAEDCLEKQPLLCYEMQTIQSMYDSISQLGKSIMHQFQ